MCKKKLLLISSDSIHIDSYLNLIGSEFADVLLLTDPNSKSRLVQTVELNFGMKNIFSIAKTKKKLNKIISEFKPDIIHIHQANSYAWHTIRAARNKSIPIVVTAWGSDVLVLPKKNILLKRMVKYVLSNATAITADSQHVLNHIKKLIPEQNKTLLLANFGIELKNKNLEKQNIIYSNRLHQPLYRIDKIIHAFAMLIRHEQNKKWKLIIAGIGSTTEDLKKTVNTLGIKNNVEFVGWVKQEINFEYYNKAKIFVSIPTSDGTAISLLEAMECGCYPVVSDIPSNQEWIEDGVNGKLVNTIDASFFENVVEEDFVTAQQLNKKIIEERATKTINKKKFLDLYESILK